MNLRELSLKMNRSMEFNGTLDDLNNEELEMIQSFVSYELQDRDMTKNKSVMGNSPKQLEIRYWEDTFGSTPLSTSSMEQVSET